MTNPFKITRFPAIIDIVAMVLIFFFVHILFNLLLSIFGFVPPATAAIDDVPIEQFLSEQMALGQYIAIVYPISMLLSIGALWLYVRHRGGKRVIRIQHSKSGFNPNIILVGVIWLLSSQIVLEPIANLLPHSEGSGLGRGIATCITAIISAPILEELLCRGLIFETLHKRWGKLISILVSALFFGVIHSDVATSFIAIVSGIIFGIIYIRTSSLYTTIIIHAINNAMAVALIGFGLGDVSFRHMLGEGVGYYVVYSLALVIFIASFVEAYFKVFKPKKVISK